MLAQRQNRKRELEGETDGVEDLHMQLEKTMHTQEKGRDREGEGEGEGEREAE